MESCVFILHIHDIKMGLEDVQSRFNYYHTNNTDDTTRPIFSLNLKKFSQNKLYSNDDKDLSNYFKTHELSIHYTFQVSKVDITSKIDSKGRKNYYFICGSCHNPVKSLFKPTLYHEPLCRKCHQLTYNSVQMHDSKLDNTNVLKTLDRFIKYNNGTPLQSIRAITFCHRIMTNEYIKKKFKTCYRLERVL